MVVFIAADILKVEQMLVVERPEVLVDTASCIFRNCLCRLQIVRWRNPYVEHTLKRSEKTDPFPIGTNLRRCPLRIAEYGCTWNERRLGVGG